LEQALAAMEVGPSDRKLAAGLQKLVEDRCSFEVIAGPEPRALRGEVFLAASAAIQNLGQGERFEREAFVREQARARNLAPEVLERALYADLHGEQILQNIDNITPVQLVQTYQNAQAQAVLLRAVNVNAEVSGADAYAYRALFRKLKFLRLLYTIAPLEKGGYRIEIDGPYSLFSSVTKYGLQLALALPALQACDQWTLEAQVRWGKQREPFVFKLQGQAGDSDALRHTPLPDEVEALVTRFQALETSWHVEAAADILELRGFGLCVPDLRFVNGDTGEIAYLEVMGYWSRDAVWKRVELARQGLPYRIIFAASSRLRVSEEVLDADCPSELYVYRGTISAKDIARRLERGGE
jgi:predicted nuclease of restriction endonuclease-like RecB superfamily